MAVISGWLIASVLVSPGPISVQANFGGPAAPPVPSIEYNRSVASCTIDVISAGNTIANGIASLSQATKTCPLGGPDAKVTCGVPVTRLVEMMLYSASFLSSAAQQCSKAFHLDGLFHGVSTGGEFFGTTQEQQACAGVITGFLGGLAQVSEASLALTEACTWFTSRSLQSKIGADLGSIPPIAEAEGVGGPKDQQQAQCSLDIVGAVSFLARAGNSLHESLKDCSQGQLQQAGSKEKAYCGYDIGNVIMSFSWVANAISMAVTHCSMLLHVDAMCAGSVTNLLSGLAALAAMGSGLEAKCPFIQKAVNGAGNLFA